MKKNETMSIMEKLWDYENGLSVLGDPLFIPSQSSQGSTLDVNNTELLKACESMVTAVNEYHELEPDDKFYYQSDDDSTGWQKPQTPQSDLDSDMEQGNVGSPSLADSFLVHDPKEYLNDPCKMVMEKNSCDLKALDPLGNSLYSCVMSPDSMCDGSTPNHTDDYDNNSTSSHEILDEIQDMVDNNIPLPDLPPDFLAQLFTLSQESQKSQSEHNNALTSGPSSDLVHFDAPAELAPSQSVKSIKTERKATSRKPAPLPVKKLVGVKRKASFGDVIDSSESVVPSRENKKQAQNREAAKRYRSKIKEDTERTKTELMAVRELHAAKFKEFREALDSRNMLLDLIREKNGEVEWPTWYRK